MAEGLRLHFADLDSRTTVVVLNEEGEPIGELYGVVAASLSYRPSDPVAHPRLTLEVAKPGFDYDLSSERARG